MRFVRYQSSNDPLPRLGWLLEDRIGAIEGSPYTEFRRLEADRALSEVRLLAPVLPGKIICVGRNYLAHAHEQNAEIPEVPLLFLKPPSSVIGPGDTILLPPQSQQVVHEAELVVVIGKPGRWIQPEDAMDYVWATPSATMSPPATCSAATGSGRAAKASTPSARWGPGSRRNSTRRTLLITCHVNGEMRQMASTRDMLFNVRQLIAYISSMMTLEPGDVLMTGTPAGVGMLQAG